MTNINDWIKEIELQLICTAPDYSDSWYDMMTDLLTYLNSQKLKRKRRCIYCWSFEHSSPKGFLKTYRRCSSCLMSWSEEDRLVKSFRDLEDLYNYQVKKYNKIKTTFTTEQLLLLYGKPKNKK